MKQNILTRTAGLFMFSMKSIVTIKIIAICSNIINNQTINQLDHKTQ